MGISALEAAPRNPGAQTPVATIDGKDIGDGTRPMTQRIRGLYKDLIAAHIA